MEKLISTKIMGTSDAQNWPCLAPNRLSFNHYTQFNKGCSFFNNLHNVIPVSTSMAMLKTTNKFKKQHDSCVYYHGLVSSKYIDGL